MKSKFICKFGLVNYYFQKVIHKYSEQDYCRTWSHDLSSLLYMNAILAIYTKHTKTSISIISEPDIIKNQSVIHNLVMFLMISKNSYRFIFKDNKLELLKTKVLVCFFDMWHSSGATTMIPFTLIRSCDQVLQQAYSEFMLL